MVTQWGQRPDPYDVFYNKLLLWSYCQVRSTGVHWRGPLIKSRFFCRIRHKILKQNEFVTFTVMNLCQLLGTFLC